MEIEKAIEILTHHKSELDAHTDADTQDAIQMGVEALEWELAFQKAFIRGRAPHLPAETKE
ncbi:hypothetical protein ES703_81858 [subsurface metagenome]